MFLQDQLLLDLERQTAATNEAHDKADDRAKELNATEGRAGIVQYLCEIGGDKYVRNRCRMFIPRMFPFKSSACVPYLVEHNGIEKAKASNTGYTPLHWASNNGHFAVVEYLVQQGADIHRLANCGSLAVHRAAAMGHLNVVKLLVEAGVDYNKLNNNGWSPLYEAAHNGHLEVVQYLTTLADADTKGLDMGDTVTKAIADAPRGPSSGNTSHPLIASSQYTYLLPQHTLNTPSQCIVFTSPLTHSLFRLLIRSTLPLILTNPRL